MDQEVFLCLTFFFSADATGKKLPGLLVCTFFGQKNPELKSMLFYLRSFWWSSVFVDTDSKFEEG